MNTKKLAVLCILLISSCKAEMEHILPMETSYYADSMDVHVWRKTYMHKSRFVIERKGKLVGELIWRYSEKNRLGLVTDTGTINSLLITDDTIYVQGQGWHLKGNNIVDSSLVLTKREPLPNPYWEIDGNATNYYSRILHGYRRRTIRCCLMCFKMYPEMEWIFDNDTLDLVRRYNEDGAEYGYYRPCRSGE